MSLCTNHEGHSTASPLNSKGKRVGGCPLHKRSGRSGWRPEVTVQRWPKGTTPPRRLWTTTWGATDSSRQLQGPRARPRLQRKGQPHSQRQPHKPPNHSSKMRRNEELNPGGRPDGPGYLLVLSALKNRLYAERMSRRTPFWLYGFSSTPKSTTRSGGWYVPNRRSQTMKVLPMFRS
jgi:hypothetical protein